MPVLPPQPEVVRAWLEFMTPAMLALLTVIQIWNAQRSAARAAEVAGKVDKVATVAAETALRQETHAIEIAGAAQTSANVVAAKVDLVASTAVSSAAVVAAKVDKVATVAAMTAARADEQVSKLAEVAEKTHILVNSQYGLALGVILEKAIRLAALTKSPADELEVLKARQILVDHQARQHVVDVAAAEAIVAASAKDKAAAKPEPETIPDKPIEPK